MGGSLQTYKTGMWGERAAALYLMAKGYRIAQRRAKTPVGEIDLIACRGKTLVFVEVKVRKKAEDALGCISEKARGRISRAAEWVGQRPDYASLDDRRIDVIAISWPFFIRHIENAW